MVLVRHDQTTETRFIILALHQIAHKPSQFSPIAYFTVRLLVDDSMIVMVDLSTPSSQSQKALEDSFVVVACF